MGKRTKRTKRSREEGVATLELVLVALPLIMVAFLLTFVGTGFSARQNIQNAVRNGGRMIAEARKSDLDNPLFREKVVSELRSALQETNIQRGEVSVSWGSDGATIVVRGVVPLIFPFPYDMPIEERATIHYDYLLGPEG